MNDRTLHVLEFDKVISLLQEQTSTIVGKNIVNDMKPSTNLTYIETMQEETDEAVHILRLNKSIPLAHVTDVSNEIERSQIGSMLDPDSCLAIAQMIYVGRNIKSFIEHLEEVETFPHLQAIVSDLFSLRHLEKEIKEKIDEHGEFVDSASTALRSIRSAIRSYETTVRDRLQHITRTKSKMLSDSIITIRNNRYVLPVKHEYRSAIGGIVHDQSTSGQTLFMEPRAVIQINNSLQQEFIKEKQEIERILQDLTKKVATHATELMNNLKVIAHIDLINARAKLSVQMKAVKPNLNNRGIIDMKQARHPLIPPKEVVANDVSLGDKYTAIVITGPNTGGKTVTLKTIGLLTLMAQSGLQVPTLDGCKLAVFENVFADIGDEQSIEQNLSTFSSHMTNIVSIMEKVNEKTLVLFDEIGAGTDPQEGAALAMALLDEVIDKEARIIATTHYPELKAYGYNRDSVMNASVEFDVETLRPTYRLLMGVPGRSNAFEISSRLGLDTNIIHRAKSYLGVDSKNVENMITALEDARKEAELKLHAAEEIMKDSTSIHQALQEKWTQFKNERDNLFKRAEDKAEKALRQAREEAEIIVSEVREMKDQTMWKEHEWIEARKLLEEAQPELVEVKQHDQRTNDARELEVGDEIKHKSLQQTGEVIEQKNENEFIIQVGMMRVTADKNDLEYIGKAKKGQESSFTSVVTTNAPVKAEIDLRGKRYEEAMHELESYMDRAVMQNYPKVTIIHGRGTGALRKGVEQFIKQSPYIKSSRFGGEGEGGSGVTIVEL